MLTSIQEQQKLNIGIFPCKSVKLKQFLLSKRVQYFSVCIDENNWTVWLFAKTPMFNLALKEWMDMKNNKQ